MCNLEDELVTQVSMVRSRHSDAQDCKSHCFSQKKNGGIRFCVDYRCLNALERKDVYPMSRIDDILDQLGGKRIFSTLNTHTGYWKIKMEEGSCEKTTLITKMDYMNLCHTF